jgi:hypothetical protein
MTRNVRPRSIQDQTAGLRLPAKGIPMAKRRSKAKKRTTSRRKSSKSDPMGAIYSLIVMAMVGIAIYFYMVHQ